MLKKNAKRKLKESVTPVLFLIGFLLAWEIFILTFNISEFFLPRPSKVFLEFATQFKFLLVHLGITMLEAVSGYILAVALSFALAVIFVHSKIIERGVYPYVIALKITPVLALAPFLVLCFGIGISSKIAIVAIICFFPLLVNTLKGFKTADEEMLDMFKSFSAGKKQIFLKLRLPNSLPYIFSGLKISTVLAMTGAFVGEYIASNKGIGYLILASARTFDTVFAFAAVIMTILAGLLFFFLISLIEKKIVFWQKSGEA